MVSYLFVVFIKLAVNNGFYNNLLYCRPDGRVFDGQWKNGLQHGEGTYTNTDGKIRSGRWDQGHRVKEPK